ncbi:DUF922 domain-containing protein [Arenimonas donghaensis]|uniref:DUF922 domain-containing protein n=1 Tax=Arenimonas donghaensis DSM 18148 = HO3-R19 TaxID=1121014 RepID=A0A087MLK4_9GAMM|nr:DUF922 domain-containing protein [Arenimonas donghaensis]KFL37757.1 hypothetical protein N788_00885 [Arenimonas donghaensis DSM 18148 = HO3-R19]
MPLIPACMEACLFVVAAVATPSDPGLRYTEQRETYAVQGINRRELRTALRRAQAEAGTMGDGSVARTSQDLSMRYELEPVEGGCRLKDLAVSLDVTIHLPEWVPEGAVRKDLMDDWNRMRDALERHEEGHRDIALESARYLLAGLRDLGLQADCQSLRREAQKVFFRAQLRYSVRDGAYEHRTQHGIAQGAVL